MNKKSIKLMKHTFFEKCNVETKLSKFILDKNQLSMGEVTFEFERKFAIWHNREFCVMVNSGSSANLVLIASLINLGKLKKGDKVGISSVTWSTNVMPLIQLGLQPVLIDVGTNDINLNSENVQNIIHDIKVLFITNVLGLEYNIKNITDICKNNNVILLEDNCEGLGCKISGILLGNFGLASTTSSFVGHHLSTIEGGYIFTDDIELAAMLKIVRSHGWTRNLSSIEKSLLDCMEVPDFYKPYTFEYCGFNVRPSEINSFCGLIQLDFLSHYNQIRQDRFIAAVDQLGDYIYKPNTQNPVFALPIRTINSYQHTKVTEILSHNNIECRPIVSGSMGSQPFWIREYGEQLCKNAVEVDQVGFYVTNDPQLSQSQFQFLINILEESLK